MQELINRLTEKAGISNEQAIKALDTIKDFVKEKFPMMAGAVDNLLGGQQSGTDTTAAAAASMPESNSFLDKVSDLIPGEAGQKAEDIAKKVADKASDVFDSAKGKLSGVFGSNKN